MQAVANGEATLNNTIAAFLGRFEPPVRPRNSAQAPAAQAVPATLGRRLQQAANYLVQSGEYSPLRNISTPESLMEKALQAFLKAGEVKARVPGGLREGLHQTNCAQPSKLQLCILLKLRDSPEEGRIPVEGQGKGSHIL